MATPQRPQLRLRGDLAAQAVPPSSRGGEDAARLHLELPFVHRVVKPGAVDAVRAERQGFDHEAIAGDRAAALVWIALPQFVLAPIAATMLRFIDARLLTAVGFALIGVACFMAAQVTDQWIGDDFLPSQIVQVLGQSIGLTSLVWLNLQHLDPSQVLTFGAVLQTGRLFGAQIGAAFVQTIIRVREQVHSNLIGLHVAKGSLLTDDRLQVYAQAVAGRSVGPPDANARATALLAHSVQIQANVLAYIDGFMIIGFAVIGMLLLMLLLRTPAGEPDAPERAGVAAA